MSANVNILERAQDFRMESPRPLHRKMPPADSFPVDALGDVLGAAARGIHDRVQAPLAICGQSVLAAATLATQGRANILLPISGNQERPLSEFYVSVAATGDRKSSCDREALWPILKHEENLRRAYQANLSRHQNDLDIYAGERNSALKSNKGDRTAKSADIEALGPPPAAPLNPMLICPEPTFEGLCKALETGQPSMGVFSDEGGQFVGGHGMNQDNRLKTATGLSSLWDGSPVRRVRSGDGMSFLAGRRVSMHLMCQPGIASKLLADGELADQGFLTRMLVTAPDSLAGTRLSKQSRPESDTAIATYGARLLSILEMPLLAKAGTQNELEPRPLKLTSSAESMWYKYVNRIEPQLCAGGALEPIRGLANKLPEHAARIAGVLALVDDPGTSEVSSAHLARAIELTEHYAAEALRIYSAGAIDGDLRLAERVRQWLAADWTEPLVSAPDIYQCGPNAVRDARTAKRAISILSEHGWLTEEQNGGVINGQKRREAWRVWRGE